MASSINASLTAGLVSTADTTGDLNLQSGGTTILAIASTGATLQGLTVGKGAGAVATNTAVGVSALAATATGVENTGIGYYALKAVTSGQTNTAVGAYSGYQITTGYANTSLGDSSLQSNVSGNANTAIGNTSLSSSTGSYNTALGTESLKSNTTASNNTAVGYQAGYTNTTGEGNTAVGRIAGGSISTGSYNTVIGSAAANDAASAITTGSQNVVIGWASDTSTAAGVNQIVIGADLTGIGDNYVTFGKSAGADRVYNQFTANATWTRSSDQRLKKEVQTNTELGLNFINDIRTVSYKWKAPNELDPSMSNYNPDVSEASYTNKMYGFIAQEVKSALDKHGVTDFAGWHVTSEEQGAIQGVSYEMFVVPLINAIQELKAEIDLLKGTK